MFKNQNKKDFIVIDEDDFPVIGLTNVPNDYSSIQRKLMEHLPKHLEGDKFRVTKFNPGDGITITFTILITLEDGEEELRDYMVYPIAIY
jgi:hypothetical protein